MAAQTSRDRKKAKMEEMEITIDEQAEEINELKTRCDQLTSEKDQMFEKYDKLEQEYEKLKIRMDLQEQTSRLNVNIKREHNIPEEHKYSLNDCSVGFEAPSGSAASLPQQKVLLGTSQSTPQMSKDVSALWRIIALCLLYRTCLKKSTVLVLQNWPKVCSQITTQKLEELIQEASKQMPRSTANMSNCLDAWWGPQNQSWSPKKIQVV